jgi:hypothetical protein
VGWEKFSNFHGRVGRLMEIQYLPSAASFGSWKLTKFPLAHVGSRKMTNFHELPSKPTEVKYPTEVSMIPVVFGSFARETTMVS